MSYATRFATNKVQEEVINVIEKWLKEMNFKIVGGTRIGKYCDTIILDLTYQGGEIYIHSNGFEDTDYGNPGVTVNDIHIKGKHDFETFKNAVMN